MSILQPPIAQRFKSRLPDAWQDRHRVKTPTVIQMEAVECGAASLAIVMGYYGRIVPLEELRVACGVSRDGSKASNVLKAARTYGFVAKGFKKEPDKLKEMRLPLIVFWNFNHFLVVEGFAKDRVYLNDPAMGPRVVTEEEFDEGFTGVVLAIEAGPDFVRGGSKPGLYRMLRGRVSGSEIALTYVVLVGLALVIPGLVIPVFSKIFVDDILIQGFRDWLTPLLIGMGLTALMRGGLTWLQQYYLLRLETKLALSMSGKFFWHVLRLPIVFFTQRYAGEIGNRVGINDRVAQLLAGELAINMLNVVMIVFYAILMFTYDATLTLVGILIACLNGAALKYIARKRIDANQKLLQDQGKLMGVSMAGLYTVETLKATGSESDFFAQWAGYQAKVMNGEQELGVATQTLGVIPALLSGINTGVILGLGGLKVMNGELTLGMLIAFQSLMGSFIDPVNKMMNLGTKLQDVEGDLNRINDVLRYQRDPQFRDEEAGVEPDDASNGHATKLSGHLELKNVSFGYSRLDPPLIENFNLTLKPGARVALIGDSGSGKSTVAKLVCGVYRPWDGEILFDGIPRDEVPRGTLTNSLAMVNQDIFLFSGTIRDNMTLWNETIPEIQLIQAAKDAHIHHDIMDRQGGYDSEVAESGVNFSGGQRQRLEIARALVGNPSIIVLDEATSALDPTTEQAVDDNLRRRGCTCLIVAHRLSTIRDCDEIIVLERGKVVQRGTHEAMKDVDGPYARLISAE